MSTRTQAQTQVLKTYVGATCKHGHLERYTSDDKCAVCVRERVRNRNAAHPEKKRMRDAAYNAAHREEKAARGAAYYAANGEKIRERSAAYAKANPEKVRERSTAYAKANPEKVREHKDAYAATHREEKRKQNAAYAKANPGATRAKSSKYRATKLQQRCTCCTDEQIQEIHEQAALCGPGAHVDHIRQLSLGGADCAKNLRAMTAGDHIEKSKLDARARADSRRRNRLLLNWRITT